MQESFDAFEYIDFLRKRWRVIAVACGVAALLALVVSLVLPKRYTATASVVIDAPSGNDVRVATAVSAVYLDSLKTFESVAASDTLFAQAVRTYHLQEGESAPSLEALKRRVLKVSKIRDTKVLEISVTLGRPEQAQAVAQYLADQTVQRSRQDSLTADNLFAEAAQTQVAQARVSLDERQKEWETLAAAEPTVGLQNAIESGIDLESQLRQQMVDAQANVAEYQLQTQAGGQFAKEQLPAAQARAGLIEKRLDELTREVQQKSALLAARYAKRESYDANLKQAQAAFDAASSRLREIRSTAGSRAEQLHVIDPGIVPQTPSSPHILINVGAALTVALIAAIVYLSMAFGYRRRAVGFQPAISRGMRA